MNWKLDNWIAVVGTGHYFFFAFPVCLLILFVLFKGRRVRFIFPSLLMTLFIVNPWFYKYWEALGLYAYWRILWIVPVIPVIVSLTPAVTEIIKSHFFRSIIVILSVIAVVFGGTFIYSTMSGQIIIPAKNLDKLPISAVKIADRLLELEEHPRVILQDPVGV
jgi:hypothetical protein